MSERFRVALQGFSAFERQGLSSYFRLAASDALQFEPVETLADSDFCVVDADRKAAVEAVHKAGRTAWAVFVGGQLPKGALIHLSRPIDPQQVSRALATLVMARRSVADPFAPSAPVEAAPAPAAASVRTAAALARANLDLEVLVVDENAAARSRLEAQLSELGCRVTQAGDADEALAQLAQQRFRVVLSVIGLAGMDGLALCQEIKRRRRGAPSVVLISQQAGASERVRATVAGSDGFLAKPVDADELLRVLRACSNRRRRAR